jgi:hypothetical protein
MLIQANRHRTFLTIAFAAQVAIRACEKETNNPKKERRDRHLQQ